ncbi:MAG: hypothetical protein IMZ53_12495 [Thermoplasmata archaeon]|nr:hypothetical protein [Thermoplasmata archaeon]MBE3141385.1 hypothetical protein [Thermoplasmata archaeon]
MKIEEYRRFLELKKMFAERAKGICEFHPERYLDEFVVMTGNGKLGFEPLKVEHVEYWDDCIYVMLGPPDCSHEGSSEIKIPLNWILDDKLYEKKRAEFKAEIEKRIREKNDSYEKRKKREAYEKILETEQGREKEKRLKEFDKKLGKEKK